MVRALIPCSVIAAVLAACSAEGPDTDPPGDEPIVAGEAADAVKKPKCGT